MAGVAGEAAPARGGPPGLMVRPWEAGEPAPRPPHGRARVWQKGWGRIRFFICPYVTRCASMRAPQRECMLWKWLLRLWTDHK